MTNQIPPDWEELPTEEFMCQIPGFNQTLNIFDQLSADLSDDNFNDVKSWPINSILVEVRFASGGRALGMYSGFSKNVFKLRTANEFSDGCDLEYELDKYNLDSRKIKQVSVLKPDRCFEQIRNVTGLAYYLRTEAAEPQPVVLRTRCLDALATIFPSIGYFLDMDTKEIRIAHSINANGETDIWNQANIEGENSIKSFYKNHRWHYISQQPYEEHLRLRGDWLRTENLFSIYTLKRTKTFDLELIVE